MSLCHNSDSEEDDENDSSLDVMSSDFDPVKALHSPDKVKLPFPDAPALDNLNKYVSLFILPRRPTITKKKKAEAGPSGIQTVTQRFLPQQEPVKVERQQKIPRDVLTRMRSFQKGPLSVLKDCLERRVRVKVFTRHMNGIRGYCIAFIAAFDKHWNLALEDVHEVWTRKKKRKIPAALGDGKCSSTRRIRKVQVPRVKVIKEDSSTETCERHVGQLMIRGEQVAIISLTT